MAKRMVKLTKGVLARDRMSNADYCYLVFFPKVEGKDIVAKKTPAGGIYWKAGVGVEVREEIWTVEGFKEKYDYNFTLPGKGKVVEDVEIEL